MKITKFLLFGPLFLFLIQVGKIGLQNCRPVCYFVCQKIAGSSKILFSLKKAIFKSTMIPRPATSEGTKRTANKTFQFFSGLSCKRQHWETRFVGGKI